MASWTSCATSASTANKSLRRWKSASGSAPGINSLKIRFNSIFGYYIEISKVNLHLAPADYERKQTLVNAERFTSPELKEYERKILAADERIAEIESRLFVELRSGVATHAVRLRVTAGAVAQIDVLTSFAKLAAERGYARPEFNISGELLIVEGRHPVIEELLRQRGERFVPNDLYLESQRQQLLLITGPNMGGKSTYLRQAALIVLMAQMGCFVPARQAKLPITDRIFTRIGASDNLARGRSTFLVEMSEVAAILHHATPASLVLLDEVGRGTSTFDGLSIAWAVVEHLQKHTGARTLFATHYHELTELAELLTAVKNVHVSVKETPNEIVFLRRVEPGSADKSYGIEVARLAGLPRSVIERAREVLLKHEQSEHELSETLSPGANGERQSQRSSGGFVHGAGSRGNREITRCRLGSTETTRRAEFVGGIEKANFMSARKKDSGMLVLGLMSGTSADGIDVALARVSGAPPNVNARLMNHTAVKLPGAVRTEILRVAEQREITAGELSQLNFRLGLLFAGAARTACKRFRVALPSLDLIGSHGQTIFHQGRPVAYLGARVSSTLQIGEAGNNCRANGSHYRRRFSPGRHGHRRAGCTVGALRRLSSIWRRESRPRFLKPGRDRQRHRHSRGRPSRRRLCLRHRSGQHVD